MAALVVILIALTTVVFPKVVLKTMMALPEYFDINPFEPGIMAYPLLVTNFILLGIAILYFKGRLHQKILGSFRFISNFEVSAGLATLIIIILVGVLVTFTVTRLLTEADFKDYYDTVKPALQTWTIASIKNGFDLHLKYFLDTTSMKLFGSYKVIPYFESISLLVLTYFFTKLITKSRFAGIVSMVILLQSGIFLIYNSSVAYDNSWILLFLLSLYVVYKFWPLSSIAFIASLFTKPYTVVFVPFTFFFIYRSGVSRKKKILTAISYVIVIVAGIAVALNFGAPTNLSHIDNYAFWSAYNAFSYQLRFDPVVVLFLLPVTVMLFMAARKGIVHADSILLLLMSTVLLQLIAALIVGYSSQPYRYMPLVTFFAIGVGTLLSKNVTVKEQVLPNKQY